MVAVGAEVSVATGVTADGTASVISGVSVGWTIPVEDGMAATSITGSSASVDVS